MLLCTLSYFPCNGHINLLLSAQNVLRKAQIPFTFHNQNLSSDVLRGLESPIDKVYQKHLWLTPAHCDGCKQYLHNSRYHTQDECGAEAEQKALQSSSGLGSKGWAALGSQNQVGWLQLHDRSPGSGGGQQHLPGRGSCGDRIAPLLCLFSSPCFLIMFYVLSFNYVIFHNKKMFLKI